MADPVIECIPNVSEGRDHGVLDRLAEAIRRVPGVRLADIHTDPDHHRSVFTFLGSPGAVEGAALALAGAVRATIDMRRHHGIHPRSGALDVLPFVPLRGALMDDAVALAHRVGESLGRMHALPIYFYAEAARAPGRRRLHDVRAGEYESLARKLEDPEWMPDAGPERFNPQLGATAVGAREVLVAYNVWLDSQDLAAAQAIARAIRESSGGLPGLQAMGVPLTRRGVTQVSMNLLDYRRTGLAQAFDAVRAEAARLRIGIARGELVGLMPREALEGRTPESVGLVDFTPAMYLETYLAPDST